MGTTPPARPPEPVRWTGCANELNAGYAADGYGRMRGMAALRTTFGVGEFGHFMAMHTAITCARAALTPDNAAAEIDRVLTEVRDRRLPGYLLVPRDDVPELLDTLTRALGHAAPTMPTSR